MARLLVRCAVLICGVMPLARAAEAPPVRPVPAIEHVVVISIDGARPDCLLLADAPTLHGLIHAGAYTFWAKTTAVSLTLPSHVSMLTGVTPPRHGIMWNRVLSFSEPVYPAFPTIFELASRRGYVTAMVAGKAKFAVMDKPGTITHAYEPPEDKGTDELVAAEAVRLIETTRPALTFVHFPSLDKIGHDKGWGSYEQLAQLAHTDQAVAQVLAALDRTGLRPSTFILITADHGGAGLTHGADDPRSRHIPWIAVGPGVRKGYDLTQRAGLDVRTEDTFATVAYVLGLPLAADLDGRPVLDAFEPAAR